MKTRDTPRQTLSHINTYKKCELLRKFVNTIGLLHECEFVAYELLFWCKSTSYYFIMIITFYHLHFNTLLCVEGCMLLIAAECVT